MKETGTTRDAIVGIADTLFYERGFERTSFSDIADAVGISRGNFYYHFKSKDEILDAVIAVRSRNTRDMLARWEARSAGPAERILCYIRIVLTNRGKIMHHGCPVGSLSVELAKLDHPLRPDASAIFQVFRDWLAAQFAALGRAKDADVLAMHVLAFSQGVAVMDNAFRDKAFVQREVERMARWLADIAATPTT
ncbi:MAG: TetR family transcriptional regulator [Rhodanobacter sp. 68-29]|uniref:TetR/AcrR family transcriptional regulator n=1 Tax=Rhodanobacter sp. PCA2 TaxID=2006117 RepID=UPI0008686361|nr:TetR/AcrR family transcriptional regulator [Rhodanobacter sp. PCA2]MBA2079371.1 TetR family transcriptional regulator [Rhodanobacter sp. PCA2]MBN8924331.1 TetR/AcrR family transcriptional regulator [Rhodanobacter sp.]ODU73643.1 MAG: transcriptional regulator [Rhodanobacter sp. SCN 69-32]OJY59079.1 MAG: TetR family transcriptional regulator [Rhodanobacter sp. 68-29]